MRVAVKAAGLTPMRALFTSHIAAKAGCITEPIDNSERTKAMRRWPISDFIGRQTVYKITRTSEAAIEVQTTPRFLELPFEEKQILAWTVFSSHFDGADEKQTVIFVDSRALERVAEFDACHGFTLR